MSEEKRRKRELLEIILAATTGDATDQQLAQLSETIVSDSSLAQYSVELLSQEAWLSWHGSQVPTSKLLEQLASQSLAGAGANEAFPFIAPSAFFARTGNVLDNSFGTSGVAAKAKSRQPSALRHRVARPQSLLIAASLLGIGALVGALVSRAWQQPQQAARNGETSAYSARFVQGTACVWGPGMPPPRMENGRLRSGESLNLIEGLAMIELDLATGGNTTLQIEGPARMVLTAEGTPSLSLGKFCADVYPAFGEFTVETPLGQVSALTDSSLGVAVYGLEVEVHVFKGQVVVASPWTSDESTVSRYTVTAGQSLRLSAADSQAVTVAHGTAEPVRFASQTSMSTDLLRISPDYVKTILQAQPLVYWRFETAKDGSIPNEVGDEFRGVIYGSPTWAAQDGNRAVEFGAGLADEVLHARVESSDSFADHISDSYTIEAWVKPSHYHLGTLSSLVRNTDEPNKPALHGALLELGGPLTTPSTIEHPGRIRFLHRDPPSDQVGTGTSCFSKSPYNLRRWEHVVAVKDGGEMRLYVDGELVAKSNDNTKLSPGLTLLVGQLDRSRDWRRFVGQLDELAIYNRALSDGEIRAHFQLVRPKQKKASSAI